MLLPTTELNIIKKCLILPHDYVYGEDGKISSNFIKSQLLFNDKSVLFSTYVRQTMFDKIIQQLNYLVIKDKNVNKIKVKGHYRRNILDKEVYPKRIKDDVYYFTLYFTLDLSELEDKIDDKIFVDIRGLQIITINNENDVNCKYLMGTIHMASTNINGYDLHSIKHMNVALSADYCLHDSIDDEDLARIIALNIYSTLDNMKKEMSDKKNLIESYG